MLCLYWRVILQQRCEIQTNFGCIRCITQILTLCQEQGPSVAGNSCTNVATPRVQLAQGCMRVPIGWIDVDGTLSVVEHFARVPATVLKACGKQVVQFLIVGVCRNACTVKRFCTAPVQAARTAMHQPSS
mmetsp:Transcript_30117/g.86237  ORF Transcript_30117/g.86237 Transcript_30117/m.86237 type:complete len:130 (+) Transcript_30117:583-972(+)